MSRTVHHIPFHRRNCSWNPRDGYRSRHQIVDLRYSALVEVEGRRLGCRPMPKERVHDRAFNGMSRGTAAREYASRQRASARRNRHSDRNTLGQLVKEINVVTTGIGAESAATCAYDAMPPLSRPVRDAEWWIW